MAPYSIKIRVLFEVHRTLWDRIQLTKLIVVMLREQKLDLDIVWTQKVWENSKTPSSFDKIRGPFFCNHHVCLTTGNEQSSLM